MAEEETFKVTDRRRRDESGEAAVEPTPPAAAAPRAPSPGPAWPGPLGSSRSRSPGAFHHACELGADEPRRSGRPGNRRAGVGSRAGQGSHRSPRATQTEDRRQSNRAREPPPRGNALRSPVALRPRGQGAARDLACLDYEAPVLELDVPHSSRHRPAEQITSRGSHDNREWPAAYRLLAEIELRQGHAPTARLATGHSRLDRDVSADRYPYGPVQLGRGQIRDELGEGGALQDAAQDRPALKDELPLAEPHGEGIEAKPRRLGQVTDHTGVDLALRKGERIL